MPKKEQAVLGSGKDRLPSALGDQTVSGD